MGNPATGNTPATAGDFNGDGIVDLTVANYTDKNVTVLLSKCDGTFTALASPAVRSNGLSAAVGDFNGDGVADIVTANYSGNSATALLASSVTKSTAQATGVSPTAAGVHNVEVSFPGDSHYLASVSGTTALIGSAPTHFSVSAPSTASAGSAISVVVTALDASNSTVPSYSSIVTPGTQTVTATDASTASITGVSGSIVVSGMPPTIAFTRLVTHRSRSAQHRTLPVLLPTVLSGPATVSGTMLTINGIGTVVVAARPAGERQLQPSYRGHTASPSSAGFLT